MKEEIRELIERSMFCREVIQQIASLLPQEDPELDALVGETVQARDQHAFIHVLVAALIAARKVDARHLAQGAVLMPNYHWLANCAWHMEGEIPEHLLTAVQSGALTYDLRATALYVAAAWCREHRGGELPPQLLPEARFLGRRHSPNEIAGVTLYALAGLLEDPGLTAVLALQKGQPIPEAVMKSAAAYGEALMGVCRREVISLIPEQVSREVSGFTVRRAVDRIGRNDPCPCGSGKKYKRCCFERDRERLQHSTDVAGKTDAELRAELDLHLTAARLDKMLAANLSRLRPEKIPADLLSKYFGRLCAFSLFEVAFAAFEKLGHEGAMAPLWYRLVFEATRAGRKEIVARFLESWPEHDENEIHTSTALLVAEDDPAKMLSLLEEFTMGALQHEEDPGELQGFAYAMLRSKFRPIGIFVARGVIPFSLPEARERDFRRSPPHPG